MEKDFSKHFIYGNFLSNPSECYPLDCETLALLQSNIKKYAVLSLLSGCDKIILSGCEVEGQTRKDGYVFIKDADSLTGEIFFHPSQTLLNSCSIAELSDTVIANGETFPDAYVTRYVKEGGNTYLWSDFTRISDISNIALKTLFEERLNTLQNVVNTAVYTPGMIILWYGDPNQVPDGWILCDGRIYNGIKIPDLRGAFVVGAGSAYKLGEYYGSNSKRITLAAKNLPPHNHTVKTKSAGSHSHTFNDYYMLENNNYNAVSGKITAKGKYPGNQGIASDCNMFYYSTHSTVEAGSHTHTVTCENTGNGEAFTVDTTPYSIALYYIMKL
jgi:microcystin-dependent protein